MYFSLKHLPIYIILADLLLTIGLNIKEAMLPSAQALPSDGLPVSPEFAFGWIQVLINGSMTLGIIWAIVILLRMRYRQTKGESPHFQAHHIFAILVVFMFSSPSLWLWIQALWRWLGEGNATISWQSWRYLLVTLCQPCLCWLLVRLLLARVRRPHHSSHS